MVSDKQHDIKALDLDQKNLSKPVSVKNIFLNGILIFFSVVFPLITLGVEFFTGMSANSFIDPISSWVYILLVASVPIINTIIWLALRQRSIKYPVIFLTANYFVIGIAFIYTLAYLPMTPIAIIATTFYGLGLLPMAPLFSLIASIILLFKLKRRLKSQAEMKFKHNYLGFIGALVFMVILEIPGLITNYGLHLYQSEDAIRKQSGLEILRTWGSESALLENTYPRSARLFDLGGLIFYGSLGSNKIVLARAAFYQVTGKSFNELPKPKSRVNGRQFGLFGSSRSNIDLDQGDQKVGGRVNKLWLDSSSIDGSIDAKAAVAYLEWTFEYKNNATRPVEVRKEIQLPPNAVISRVTLWVNGEEREAVIAKKQKAVRAYRAIVARQRDPILVTLSGKDRALVQMFPVPANGGKMKARIGFSVPLAINREEKGVLVLPKFNSRNFNISRGFKHSVWVEASHTNRLQINGVKHDSSKTVTSVRKQIIHSQYQRRKFYFKVRRPDKALTSFSPLDNAQSDKIIRQTLSESKKQYQQIIVVIDGSKGMKKQIIKIAEAIENLTDNIDIEFIIAGDEPIVLHPLSKLNKTAKTKLISGLKNYQFQGGANNITALELAVNHIVGNPHTALVWIHGPQPYLLKSLSHLNQFWQRRSNAGTTLYYVPTSLGANKIIQSLPKSARAYYADPYQNVVASLDKLFAQLTGQIKTFRREYSLIDKKNLDNATHKTSNHLVRLWANSKILALLRSATPEGKEEAIRLSSQYKLVTAASGAIVLETDQQYKQFGLNKGKKNGFNIPAVPEPETWMLIILSLLALIFAIAVQRKQTARAENG